MENVLHDEVLFNISHEYNAAKERVASDKKSENGDGSYTSYAPVLGGFRWG